ncbi:MAG: hypothetical protein KKA42_04340 [candidate division Zixibacteria bacterium]|nr:hypothetical protein [candidate division Zixibacteria bacterium]
MRIAMLTMLLLPALLNCSPTVAAQVTPAGEVDSLITIFDHASVHFAPNDSDRTATEQLWWEDNGRYVCTGALLPDSLTDVRVVAHLALHPIPKDEQFVHDKWDRAGSVRLSTEGGPDVEIVKFVTAYGGYREFDVDVTHLLPLLRGKCVVKAFIDTWVNPAWLVDFSLRYVTDGEAVPPDWAAGAMLVESFDVREFDSSGISTTMVVPQGLERVKLFYYVSGHCTDGRGADEFVSKDNVISVDGRVVYRFQPWRDDCRSFRDANPYCRRWSDGSWSSDYSRSGWCPGDVVAPVELDLTDHLDAGEHTLTFNIEGMRPVDDDGSYGYWRISAQLIGWREK